MEFSPVFKDNMIRLLGSSYEEYEQSFSGKRLYGLRTNRLKISEDEFENISPFKTERIPWIDNGYYYDSCDRPAKHPYYYAGLYYLQEPSAMTPAGRLPIEPGDHVLDLCAAPGGKSTELGAKLLGTGLLVSNDISNSRAQALLKNIELFGIGNAVVMSESPHKIARMMPEFFDKILIDAPCSGEGMFRKDPSVMKAWTPQSNEKFSALQREILSHAVTMLKPGGLLMYSTCTFSPLENEGSVSYVLDNFSDMSLTDILPYEGFLRGMDAYGNQDASLKKCVRIWPHVMKGEGHFLALFKKNESGSDICKKSCAASNKQPGANGLSDLLDFLRHIDRKFCLDRLNVRPNGSVTYLPEDMPSLAGLRLMRTGLLLGELKKNRFEPSQALAMNLRESEFDCTVSFCCDDQRCVKYLKGETVTVSSDEISGEMSGWCLVCADHFPLGFAKLNAGVLKNKYLPGWRWQ